MFTHKLDKHRVIEFILRYPRLPFPSDELSFRRDAIAHRARISTSVLSNVLNLSNGNAVTEDTFLRTITQGMRLPYADVKTLLWLFNGRELTDEDAVFYLGYLPPDIRRDLELDSGSDLADLIEETRPKAGEDKGSLTTMEDAGERAERSMAMRVLVLLRRSYANAFAHTGEDSALRRPGRPPKRYINGAIDTQVTIYGPGGQGRIQYEEQLLALEKQPGQRLRTAQLPSAVSFDETIHQEKVSNGTPLVDLILGLDRAGLTEKDHVRIREGFRERSEIYRVNLEIFGGRTIIQKDAIRWYLSDRTGFARSLPLRRRHIANFLALMGFDREGTFIRSSRQGRLSVALTERAADFETNLKSICLAMLRSPRQSEVTENYPAYGYQAMYFRDPLNLVRLYMDFELQWYSNNTIRDERAVRDFLLGEITHRPSLAGSNP